VPPPPERGFADEPSPAPDDVLPPPEVELPSLVVPLEPEIVPPEIVPPEIVPPEIVPLEVVSPDDDPPFVIDPPESAVP
jgi:hypothetical protein